MADAGGHAQGGYGPALVDFERPAATRAMIPHILEHAHIEGTDRRGRPIMRLEFPVEPWTIDRLAVFGAAAEDLEPEPVRDGDEAADEVPPLERVA
jgi:hypothetical protein